MVLKNKYEFLLNSEFWPYVVNKFRKNLIALKFLPGKLEETHILLNSDTLKRQQIWLPSLKYLNKMISYTEDFFKRIA